MRNTAAKKSATPARSVKKTTAATPAAKKSATSARPVKKITAAKPAKKSTPSARPVKKITAATPAKKSATPVRPVKKLIAATPAVKKSTAVAPVAKKATVTAKSIATKVTADPKKTISDEQRHIMISEAAYYIAEKSGFNPDHSAQYWEEAENQINTLYK